MRALLRRLRARIKYRHFDRDLAQELEQHRALAEAELTAAGRSAREARWQAARLLGNTTLAREDSRAAWIPMMWQQVAQDARYVARGLRRAPGFVVAAVIVLSLGSAITGAVFSTMTGWLSFRSAVPNADRLFFLAPTHHGAAVPSEYFKETSYTRLFELKLATVRSLFATTPVPVIVSTNGLSVRVRMEAITGEYFRAIGVPALLGRAIQPDDDRAGGAVPVVLGESAWRRLFAGDTHVIGRSIRVSGLYCTIVGVMPGALRGFTSPTSTAADVWAPMTPVKSVVKPGGTAIWAQVFGRLADDASFREAEAEIRVAGTGFDPAAVDLGAAALPVEQGVAPMRTRLAIGAMSTGLVALSALVLLIACANLANLLLARSASRSAEFAIRMALGASPSRILRLQLLETASIAAMGGAAGFAFVSWFGHIIGRFTLYSNGGSVMTGTMLVNSWVIAYFFVVMAATAIAIGTAPALRAIRLDPGKILASSGSRGGTGRRFERNRTLLVASQIAASTVLLIVATLFVQSALRTSRYDVAFETQHVVIGSFDLSAPGLDESRGRIEQEALLVKARSLPAIRNAAVSTGLPARGGGEMVSIEAAEVSFSERQFGPPCRCLSVSPDFLNVIGLSPLRGRGFDRSDADPGRGTVIVNQTAASRLWAESDPIGRQLRIRKGQPMVVVGLVADTDRTTTDVSDRCTIFVPMAQRYSPHFLLAAAGTSPAPLLLKPFEAAMTDVLPDASMFDIQTAQSHVTRGAGFLRSMAAALAMLGGLGLTIAIVGLYGVTAYVVGLRRAEFGVRKALGATNACVYRLVLLDASRMVSIGLLVGVPIAFLVSILLTRTLVGVTSHDAATYIAVPAGLMVLALVVTWHPAWRAAREEPAVTLRDL